MSEDLGYKYLWLINGKECQCTSMPFDKQESLYESQQRGAKLSAKSGEAIEIIKVVVN